jgi:pyridoxal phosphate enzyme (YggS family)
MIAQKLLAVKKGLPPGVALVAVSKTVPVAAIGEAYQAGQRIFGENKIQEMADKFHALPKDIEWHMIGHVQSNKVKYMAPFVSLVHGVDSLKLLSEIDRQAKRCSRTIAVLLQIHIASEETKFGMSEAEAENLLASDASKSMENVTVKGLMGMASFTDDIAQVRREFGSLKRFFDKLRATNPHFDTLSMGMSGDYRIAIDCGSTMVRIGSAIFGSRN